MRRSVLATTAVLVATTFLPVDYAATEEEPHGEWDVGVHGDPGAADPGDGALAVDDRAALADVDVADDAAPEPPAALPWTARARISAYAPGCGDSGLTRTGTRPRWGTVAVDPRYIPLHSRLNIEGFDGVTFDALDTGSAVIGWKVDVWMSSCAQARAWGVRKRAVRVLP